MGLLWVVNDVPSTCWKLLSSLKTYVGFCMVEDGHLPFRLHHTVHGCHLALSGTHSITKPAFAMARKAACKPDTKNGCTSNPPHLQADSTGGTHLSKQYVSSKRIDTPKMIQKGPCQRKPEHTMSQPTFSPKPRDLLHATEASRAELWPRIAENDEKIPIPPKVRVS